MLKKGLFIVVCGVVGLLTVAAHSVETYQLPVIPDSLTSFDERGNYLIEHYWDNFDVENRATLDRREEVEQIFVGYIEMLAVASRESTMKSIATLMNRAGNDEALLLMYADLAERYLYNGEGGVISEEAYLPFVEAVIDSKKVSKLNKLRYTYQYNVLTQNQLGMKVTNFEYKLPKVKKQLRIAKMQSPFILLYINDPDCDDCSLATLRLSVSQALLKEIRNGRLTVLSLFPDGETEEWLSQVEEYPKEWIVASMENGDQVFDLRSMPIVYLLDKDKKIVLKNPSLEELENYLKEK